jgi:hypothetical protein
MLKYILKEKQYFEKSIFKKTSHFFIIKIKLSDQIFLFNLSLKNKSGRENAQNNCVERAKNVGKLGE